MPRLPPRGERPEAGQPRIRPARCRAGEATIFGEDTPSILRVWSIVEYLREAARGAVRRWMSADPLVDRRVVDPAGAVALSTRRAGGPIYRVRETTVSRTATLCLGRAPWGRVVLLRSGGCSCCYMPHPTLKSSRKAETLARKERLRAWRSRTVHALRTFSSFCACSSQRRSLAPARRCCDRSPSHKSISAQISATMSRNPENYGWTYQVRRRRISTLEAPAEEASRAKSSGAGSATAGARRNPSTAAGPTGRGSAFRSTRPGKIMPCAGGGAARGAGFLRPSFAGPPPPLSARARTSRAASRSTKRATSRWTTTIPLEP